MHALDGGKREDPDKTPRVSSLCIRITTMEKWPGFNKNGDLPAGIHQASLKDVVEHFGKGRFQRSILGQRPAISQKPFDRDFESYLHGGRPEESPEAGTLSLSFHFLIS